MSLENSYKHFEQARGEALDWFRNEIVGLRTGRVKTGLIETIQVEHYGARTPLKGVASITLSDARTIVITPWDPTAVPAIEKAVTGANLGVQPIVDGKIIRVAFPSLSEEMREQTVKQLHKKAEEARVRLRKARDESLSQLKTDKQSSDITEDDFYDGKKKLDDMIDEQNKAIAEIIEQKEAEIRTI